MESAIFGLIGVVVGSALTLAREWWFQRRKEKKDADYLAIQVVYQLERYIVGCAEVVGDDGLCEGQPDQDGYSRIQVQAPKFDPDALKVEWKSLPTDLLYEVFDLPRQAEAAQQKVNHAFDYSDPPDYCDGFEERQYEYASLGVAASQLVTRLRQHANLPGSYYGSWNPVAFMQEQQARIHERRVGRRARQSSTGLF